MAMSNVSRLAIFTVLEHLVATEDEDLLKPRENFALIAASALASHRRDRQKIPQYVETIVPGYTAQQFKTFFRVSGPTFELLCNELSHFPELKRRELDCGGRPEISLDKQVLLTLWYLGSQETVRSIADRFHISESTFIVRHRQILSALCTMSERYVRWPMPHEYRQIADGFAAKHEFPDILGAIDGTHIRIEAPNERPADYFNRKGYHSVILQAVCREDKRFTDMYMGWPGKVHDARVFRNSPLYARAPQLIGQRHLLGDGAYPIKSWLLPPFRDNGRLTPQQRRYNKYHSSARVAIEHSFGMVKGRFRRMQNIIVRDIQNILKVIAACMTLHNICILSNDNLDDFYEDEEAYEVIGHNLVHPRNDAVGTQKRIDIMTQLR